MAFTLHFAAEYTLDSIPASNLTAFPKLFIITGDSRIAAECASGGGIQVKAADNTTILPIEVIWSLTDLASGDVAFYVPLDLLTAANVGDPTCYIYYDGSETTTEDHASVWVDFNRVLHFEEDPSGSAPQIYDSVSQTKIGTSAGSMTNGDLVDAPVGKGLEFDGTDDIITFANAAVFVSDLTTSHTVEIGFKTSASNNSNKWAFGGGASGAPIWGLPIEESDFGTGFAAAYRDNSDRWAYRGASQTINNNTDRVVGFVKSGNTAGDINLIVDGVNATGQSNLLNSGFATLDETSIGFGIGGAVFNGSSTAWLPSTFWEFRVSSVVRSADWIAYTAQDLLNNADTFTLGAEQGGGVGPTPIGGSDNPSAALSEAIAILAGLSLTDTPTAGITDTATLLGLLALTDAPAWALSDWSAIMATFAAVDSPAWAISEAVELAATIGTEDSPSAAIGDASAIQAGLGLIDSPAAAIGDLAAIFGDCALSDNPTCTLNDAAALQCMLSLTDGVIWAISDATAIAVVLAVADTLSAAANDASSLLIITPTAGNRLRGRVLSYPRLRGRFRQ